MTTMRALEDGVGSKTQCIALGVDKPWQGDCLSHAVNGGMNKACVNLVAEKKLRRKRGAASMMDDEEDGSEVGDINPDGPLVISSSTMESGGQVSASFKLSDVMKKSQSCITWTKKSSVGWKCMQQAGEVTLRPALCSCS